MGGRDGLRDGLQVSVCAPEALPLHLRPIIPAWQVPRARGPWLGSELHPRGSAPPSSAHHPSLAGPGGRGSMAGLGVSGSGVHVSLVSLGTGHQSSQMTGTGTGLEGVKTVPTSRWTAAGMMTSARGPTAGSVRPSGTEAMTAKSLLSPNLFPQCLYLP